MREHAKHVAWLICLVLLATPVAASANTFEGNAEDVDGDGVPNREDRDTDNDGILDSIECPAADACPDSDMDGVPDYLDLDSDGDGITDAYEAYGNDADGDGCYDGFEDRNRDGADDTLVETGDAPIDSDNDDTPDFLDEDSDDDGIPDATEGHDADADGAPDTVPTGIDVDRDGLDDAFDAHCTRVDLCENGTMLSGKPAPTPDHDGDGVDDFRQPAEPSNPDAGPDAGMDAGTDVGMDAGVDDGSDAGMDTGTDASNPDVSDDARTSIDHDLYVSGGGCRSVPAGGPATIWWVLFLAITVLRRRRR